MREKVLNKSRITYVKTIKKHQKIRMISHKNNNKNLSMKKKTKTAKIMPIILGQM